MVGVAAKVPDFATGEASNPGNVLSKAYKAKQVKAALVHASKARGRNRSLLAGGGTVMYLT